MIRLLVLQSETGLGHRRAAESVAQELLTRALPGQIEVDVVDTFVDLRVPVLRHAPRIYDSLSKRYRAIFDLGYRLSNWSSVDPLLGTLISRVIARYLQARLDTAPVDAILVVHPFYSSRAAQLVSRDAERNIPVVVLVTDPVSVHRSWLGWNADLTLATTEDALTQLSKYGVTANVARTIYPLKAEYKLPVVSPCDGRSRLGLSERPTVLVTGGGVGGGGLVELVGFLSRRLDVQLIVACGRNASARQQLIHASQQSVHVLGPVRSLLPYYDAADYVIGKSGPATIFECLARRRPFLATSEVGRQEYGNSSLVERLGIGIDCRTNWERATDAILQGWQPEIKVREESAQTADETILDYLTGVARGRSESLDGGIHHQQGGLAWDGEWSGR